MSILARKGQATGGQRSSALQRASLQLRGQRVATSQAKAEPSEEDDIAAYLSGLSKRTAQVNQSQDVVDIENYEDISITTSESEMKAKPKPAPVPVSTSKFLKKKPNSSPASRPVPTPQKSQESAALSKASSFMKKQKKNALALRLSDSMSISVDTSEDLDSPRKSARKKVTFSPKHRVMGEHEELQSAAQGGKNRKNGGESALTSVLKKPPVKPVAADSDDSSHFGKGGNRFLKKKSTANEEKPEEELINLRGSTDTSIEIDASFPSTPRAKEHSDTETDISEEINPMANVMDLDALSELVVMQPDTSPRLKTVESNVRTRTESPRNSPHHSPHHSPRHAPVSPKSPKTVTFSEELFKKKPKDRHKSKSKSQRRTPSPNIFHAARSTHVSSISEDISRNESISEALTISSMNHRRARTPDDDSIPEQIGSTRSQRTTDAYQIDSETEIHTESEAQQTSSASEISSEIRTDSYTDDFETASKTSRRTSRRSASPASYTEFSSSSRRSRTSPTRTRTYTSSTDSSDDSGTYTEDYTDDFTTARSTPSYHRSSRSEVRVRGPHRVCTIETQTDDIPQQLPPTVQPPFWPGPGLHQLGTPTPLLRHIVSPETLDAVTTYEPIEVLLHSLLKEQLELSRTFLTSQHQMYSSMCAAMAPDYSYTSLAETKEFIRRHRPKQISYEEALKQVEAEMRD